MSPFLWLLLACKGPSAPAGDESPVETGDTAPEDGGEFGEGGPAPLVEPSAGDCPTFAETGAMTLTSGGKERKVRVYFPEDRPAGMPLVFAWHWLGGSAREIEAAMDLEAFATEQQAVVVIPEASGDHAYEWDFLGEGADDLALFDDLRTCLYRELAIDPYRVSATGMSAGGLWTTKLSIERGDALSTVLVFSGGTEPIVPYETPAAKFPALLVWGGESDMYGQLSFDTTMRAYADALVADGHYVIACDHGRGHTLPPETADLVATWLPAHRYGGAAPADVVPLSALPEYCWVP